MPSQSLGLSCALSTPFRHDARVDTTRLADHANWCLAQGCDSITLFGTTGEGAAVGVADRAQSIKALLAGIAPARLLSGVTACAPDDAAAQARVATDAGLHGLLLTPPWYFRDVSDDGLFAWFARVLEMIGNARNVYLYHIPSMTGVPLSVDLVGRLKTAFPGVVVGVKDSLGRMGEHRKAARRASRPADPGRRRAPARPRGAPGRRRHDLRARQPAARHRAQGRA